MKDITRLFIGSIILLTYACSQSSSERDHISFKTPVKSIEDSIIQMNNLMKKLPVEAEMINYFFDYENSLYVNNLKLGKLESFNPDTFAVFKSMTAKEKKNFLTIALFLRENEISGNHFDDLFNTWRYSYKPTEDNSFRDSRSIFLKEPNTPINDIQQAHIILDEKGDLILIKARQN